MARPTLRNFINAAALTGVSAYAMVYLRLGTVLLFGLYGLLAFLFWYFLKQLNAVRIVSAIFVLCVLLVGSGFLVGYTDMALEAQSKGIMGYTEQAANTRSTGSLGIRLVVNQPLPIRLVLGSGALMNLIPLWTNFKIGLLDYHWIKGYNGIYQVVVLPFFFAGFLAVFRLSRRVRKEKIPLLFYSSIC